MQNKSENKFRKKWRLVPVSIIIILSVIISATGCTKEAAATKAPQASGQSKNPTAAPPKTETPDETDTPDETENPAPVPEPRDNSSAVLTTLETGEYVVGKDIPQGRYIITNESYGGIDVRNPDARKDLPYIINSNSSDSSSVAKSFTMNIENEQIVDLWKGGTFTFTPIETTLSTTLTTGFWIVGLDIPAGDYEAACGEQDLGNLAIYDNGKQILSQTLARNDSDPVWPEKIDVTLKNGQEIRITAKKIIFMD